MKIIFLISQIPYPPDTGAKIRSFNLIRRLAERHEITLVTYADKNRELSKIEALRKYCKKVIVVRRSGKPALYTLFTNIFSVFPYTIDKYYSKDMERRISELIKDGKYDLVHCDSLQMSLNLRSAANVPLVLTEHNVESQILERCVLNEKNFLKKTYIKLQTQKLSDYEISACRSFNRCITVSETDRFYLADNSGIDTISVVPNGVDCEYFRPQNARIKPYRLVFTGSLDWLPNEDALVYFFNDIYPALKRKVPGLNITVVGRNPSQKLLRIAEREPRIHITGSVNDVRPYIAESEIFIVPLRIGGGTRLKILEAMAMGKPVISTSIGAEGLDVEDGRNILLADMPEDFNRHIIELFQNNEKRSKLAKAGRKLVEEKYDWSKIAKELERAWRKVA